MHSQLRSAQAIRLRDTEGSALRANRSHVAQTKRGHAMRTFDFAPFYRSTVGFDRVFSTLDQLVGVDGSVPSYPPYNIARTDESSFQLADYVQVKGASLENGLLHLDLVREIPEAARVMGFYIILRARRLNW